MRPASGDAAGSQTAAAPPAARPAPSASAAGHRRRAAPRAPLRSTASAIGPSASSGWWRLRRTSRSTWAIAPCRPARRRRRAASPSRPRSRWRRAGARRARAGAANSPASGWANPRQLGVERRQERPRRELGHPAAAVRLLVPSPARERPPVDGPSRSARPARSRSGPSSPVAKWRREAARVRVEVDDHSPRAHRQRAPHRVALAEHRSESGSRSASWCTSAPRARGHLGGAVGRGGVDHQHLVDQRVKAERAAPRSAHGVGHLARGKHHRDRLLLRFGQPLERGRE